MALTNEDIINAVSEMSVMRDESRPPQLPARLPLLRLLKSRPNSLSFWLTLARRK